MNYISFAGILYYLTSRLRIAYGLFAFNIETQRRWIRIPVQVLEQGRRVVFRVLSDSPQAQNLMEAARTLKRLSECQSEMNV